MKYLSYFNTIYNEPEPIGNLGRGTHYSILRAVVFQDESGGILERAVFHDFAIVWDEDHDTRILSVIEELYFMGLLGIVKIVGERKGCVTILYGENCSSSQLDRLKKVSIQDIVYEKVGDHWSTVISSWRDPKDIINDDKEKVRLYINNIMMLWGLDKHSLD